MNIRQKHFTKLRAKEIRRKPPTKAQNRNQMSAYLKNMAGYKHSQLKSKSYDEIQKLFDKEMKRVNTFVDMNSEVVKGRETRTEERSKRAGDDLESNMLKKQKIDKHVEVEKDDQEEAKMKRHIEIVKMMSFEYLFTPVRPRAKGIIFHDQEEQVPASTKTFYSSQSQLPHVKDKGKGKMVEPEVPLKKKDQVALDEEMARNLKAQLQDELIEEERLARQKEEEANITLIES
ncbi:hypothetical protein Tco_1485168 [Tanacetum coccineum]